MADEMEATRASKKQKTEISSEMIISARKQKLEMAFGVHIAEDALTFAAQLLHACQNKWNLLEDMDAMQLVERACQRLRESLDSDNDSEERNLDWDEYYLDRAFVEVMELKKEKSLDCRSVFLPHVERDLVEFKTRWERFESKWAPLVAQMRNESEKRVNLLRHLRYQVVYFMERTKTEGSAEAERLAQLLPGLNATISQLQHTIPSAFKERLIVEPLVIAQVASSMTGLPLKYFQSPFNLRLMLENLKSKLSARLIGLDDVIHKIACALSKQKSSRGPFGSFLLLGPHGCGRAKLAETLAEEIFYDKSRFIKLDMSQYKESDYVSLLVAALHRDKMHGRVVMFDNIENAPNCSIEILSQILRDGVLTDGKGVCVDFSLDILLVSSHIGHEVFAYCRCLRNTIPKHPFQEILKEPALLHLQMDLDPEKSFDACYLRPFYVKVAKYFKLEFMDLFDDVVVFPWLRPLDYMAIFRLQIRDAAASMSTFKKQVILYPSYAALNSMTCLRDLLKSGAHVNKTQYQVHVESSLNDYILKNKTDDKIIIYIDAVLGFRNKYSFRVETSRQHLERHLDVKSFKENVWKQRSRYRREKVQVNKIYRLQISYSHLLELINTKAGIDAALLLKKSEEVVRLIGDILLNDVLESDLVHVDDLMCCPTVRRTSKAKTCLKHLSNRLQSSLKVRDKATQVIIKAQLRHLHTSVSCHLPESFLCLGLKLLSKNQFAKSLMEHLVVDGGEKLLIQVDLSPCTGPESFFRYARDVDSQMLFTECVKRIPHSVIVFYNLEMAHISVFSTLLSILEDGASKDNDGNVIDFGNSVIVIISDLGDSEMIGGFNGHLSRIILPNDPIGVEISSSGVEVVGPSSAHEMELRGLRFELLNLLDHMLLFDPFSGDQLNKFAKLSLRSLEEKSCSSLYLAFFHLFYVHRKKRFMNRGYTTESLLMSLKNAGGKDVIVRYGSRRLKNSEDSSDAKYS